jgi:hypothetical protein
MIGCESIDTSTYEFDPAILKEYGQVAQASRITDFDRLGGSLLLGVRPSFNGVAVWLHENADMMSTYAAVAELSASIRTHPRHIMDASRLIGIHKKFRNEINELASDMLTGKLIDVSDSLRLLATEALAVIDRDLSASGEEIIDWANSLAKDCFGWHD